MDTAQTKHSTPVSAQIIVTIVIVILGSCLGNLSQTALNAMFSGIAKDFAIDVSSGQLVTTLYMLVLGITVPSLTFLMRRFSVKTIVIAALFLLLVGSLIDIVAQNFWVLMTGRVLQAVSSGITLPMMMSLIMMYFPRNKQATVMGIAGIAMGFAPNIGPTIGGWVVSVSVWQSFFVLLALASCVLLVAALISINSSSPTQKDARFDGLSFVLSALGFGGLLAGFSNASSYEITSPFIWTPVIIGAVALALFLYRQKRVKEPLINLDIFQSKQYRIGFWAINFLFASFMGITLILPLFVEDVWQGTALQAGLSLLPSTVAALFINPLAGVLTDKIGVRGVVVCAGIFLFVGAASMIGLDKNTPFFVIVILQGVRAIGVSGLIGPLSSWSMAKLPLNLMTDASSFSTAVRQACASLGCAFMVCMVSLAPEFFASFGFDTLLSTTFAYQLAFAISALFALALLIIVLAQVRQK